MYFGQFGATGEGSVKPGHRTALRSSSLSVGSQNSYEVQLSSMNLQVIQGFRGGSRTFGGFLEALLEHDRTSLRNLDRIFCQLRRDSFGRCIGVL